MESDKRQRKKRSAKAACREADDSPNEQKNWRTYLRKTAALDARVLRVIDMQKRVIWINSTAAPDDNVVYLRCRKCEER